MGGFIEMSFAEGIEEGLKKYFEEVRKEKVEFRKVQWELGNLILSIHRQL